MSHTVYTYILTMLPPHQRITGRAPRNVPFAMRPLAVRPLAVRPLAVRPLAVRPLEKFPPYFIQN
jgi:hypothetical protein